MYSWSKFWDQFIFGLRHLTVVLNASILRTNYFSKKKKNASWILRTNYFSKQKKERVNFVSLIQVINYYHGLSNIHMSPYLRLVTCHVLTILLCVLSLEKTDCVHVVTVGVVYFENLRSGSKNICLRKKYALDIVAIEFCMVVVQMTIVR